MKISLQTHSMVSAVVLASFSSEFSVGLPVYIFFKLPCMLSLHGALGPGAAGPCVGLRLEDASRRALREYLMALTSRSTTER